jgi:hypothetical protein
VFKLAEMKRKADQENANRSVLLSGYRGSSLPLEAGQASPEILAGFVSQGNKQADEARQQQAFIVGMQKQREILTADKSIPDAAKAAQLAEIESKLAVAQAGGRLTGDPFNIPNFNANAARLGELYQRRLDESPIKKLVEREYFSVLDQQAKAEESGAAPEDLAKFEAKKQSLRKELLSLDAQTRQQAQPAAGQAAPAAQIDPAALAQKTITLPDGTVEQVDPSVMQEAVRMARQWFIDYAQRDPDTATPDERVEKTALFYAKIREQRLADHAIAAKSRTAEVMQGAAGARAQPRKPQPQQWQPMYPPPMPIR